MEIYSLKFYYFLLLVILFSESPNSSKFPNYSSMMKLLL